MLDYTGTAQDPRQFSPLTLAFLGDAVFELCARQRVLESGNQPVNGLHKQAVALVNAGAQSQGLEKILGQLTEEEMAVYKRGRNATSNSAPKHAELSDYRRATGVEALFGYLYLMGRQERIAELFAQMNPPETGMQDG